MLVIAHMEIESWRWSLASLRLLEQQFDLVRKLSDILLKLFGLCVTSIDLFAELLSVEGLVDLFPVACGWTKFLPFAYIDLESSIDFLLIIGCLYGILLNEQVQSLHEPSQIVWESTLLKFLLDDLIINLREAG